MPARWTWIGFILPWGRPLFSQPVYWGTKSLRFTCKPLKVDGVKCSSLEGARYESVRLFAHLCFDSIYSVLVQYALYRNKRIRPHCPFWAEKHDIRYNKWLLQCGSSLAVKRQQIKEIQSCPKWFIHAYIYREHIPLTVSGIFHTVNQTKIVYKASRWSKTKRETNRFRDLN